MPSSISSSESDPFVREVPELNWSRMFVMALLLTAVSTFVWELHVRGLGYGPNYADTPNLWAPQRERAENTDNTQVVFVGSSRTLFDMDLKAFQEEVGGALPVELATVGSNPLPILEELAQSPEFRGTVIVGIVPGLAAAAAGPPISTPQKYLAHYKAWSPAQRFELPLVLFLEDHLALINQDALTLSALIGGTDLPLRDKVYAPPMPGYIKTLDRTRQGRMVDRLTSDPKEAAKVQQIWLTLFRGPPRPPVFTEEKWSEMLAAGWDANLVRFKSSVEKIKKRGGRVIFSRLPSSGGVRALENKGTPRALFWDRLLRETHSPGIHFEDYDELKGFSCPEWSHLAPDDATAYTRLFARILRAEGHL